MRDTLLSGLSKWVLGNRHSHELRTLMPPTLTFRGDAHKVPISTKKNYHCRPVLSNVLILAWIAVLSGILIVVADRFFCPALEVLSDYFQLPANVAGATLLSFGNGAPDVFTMLAAVSTVRSGAGTHTRCRVLNAGCIVAHTLCASSDDVSDALQSTCCIHLAVQTPQ